MHLQILTVLFLGLASAANCGPFTSLINLEKLYTLEDELITIADVTVKQERRIHEEEGEDIHHLDKLDSTVENVKNIHRKVGGENTTEFNITQYILHPINVFHLTKRLVKQWSSVVKTLRDSKTCVLPMRHKIDNIGDNIPSEEHLTAVGKAIINIQSIHDIPTDDIIRGNIFGNSSLEPLSVDDQYTLARAAYDAEDFNLAVDWLLKVTSNYANETDVKFSLANVLNVLSSSYYKLKRPDDALTTLDKILEMDPENKMAIRNKKFMTQKLESGQEDETRGKPDPEKRKEKLVQDLCSGKTTKNASKQSQLKCVYLRKRNQPMFTRPMIQGEIMNVKPLIILFHNFTNRSMQNATLHLGQQMMRDSMYTFYYKNPGGIGSIEIEGDDDDEEFLSILEKNLLKIHLTPTKPTSSEFLVRNIGMEGYTSGSQLEAERYYMGSFQIFLSEMKHGGEIVFPFSKTKVIPQKGSVLFYEKKLHKQMSICPVILDTEWLAEYQLYDREDRNVCHIEKFIKPDLS